MRVVARNQHDAIQRIEHTDQAREFLQGETIKGFDVKPIEFESIDNTRFVVTNILNKQGWYVAADLDNHLKVEWKRGKYNETQKVVYWGAPDTEPDPLDQATALREIGEYLYLNFKELV